MSSSQNDKNARERLERIEQHLSEIEKEFNALRVEGVINTSKKERDLIERFSRIVYGRKILTLPRVIKTSPIKPTKSQI